MSAEDQFAMEVKQANFAFLSSIDISSDFSPSRPEVQLPDEVKVAISIIYRILNDHSCQEHGKSGTVL